MKKSSAGPASEPDIVSLNLQHWIVRKCTHLAELQSLGIAGVSKVGTNAFVIWGYGPTYDEYSDVREALFAKSGIEVVDTLDYLRPDIWAEFVTGAPYHTLMSAIKAARYAYEADECEVAEDPDADNA